MREGIGIRIGEIVGVEVHEREIVRVQIHSRFVVVCVAGVTAISTNYEGLKPCNVDAIRFDVKNLTGSTSIYRFNLV